MPYFMNSLSLVIPAHNSEKVIEPSLETYNNHFAPKFRDFEGKNKLILLDFPR